MPFSFFSGVRRERLVRAGLWTWGAAVLLAAPSGLSAQTVIGAGTTVESFDAIGTGLPTNWSVRTGASASALGTAGAFTTTAATWIGTTGNFRNVASALNVGVTSTDSTALQNGYANRALGVRQGGSFGDAGAEFAFQVSTLGVSVSDIRFSAQILDVEDRSTTWSLQYGLGASPTAFTTIGTFSDPAVFGATPVIASAFGDALNNQASIWLRVVALTPSTGSGSRDTFAIDDFSITATAVPEPGAFALLGGAAALGLALSLRRRR